MKYMHAIGQHQRLSLANGLLQMFSQADKLRTVSSGMPGVKKKKKKKDIRISKLKIECQPTERIIEYSGPALYYTHIVCKHKLILWIQLIAINCFAALKRSISLLLYID